MKPTMAGQKVRVVPEFLDHTELDLDTTYEVKHVQTYRDDQPTKVFIIGQPEAIYADFVFSVVDC